jgi:hypothetical protein
MNVICVMSVGACNGTGKLTEPGTYTSEAWHNLLHEHPAPEAKRSRFVSFLSGLAF